MDSRWLFLKSLKIRLLVGQRLFLFGNHFAPLSHFSIHFDVFFPLFRNIVLVENSLDGAFWHACLAVNAFFGMDVQHLFPFVEAFHWANYHTIRISASKTGLRNNVRHYLFLNPQQTNDRQRLVDSRNVVISCQRSEINQAVCLRRATRPPNMEARPFSIAQQTRRSLRSAPCHSFRFNSSSGFNFA